MADCMSATVPFAIVESVSILSTLATTPISVESRQSARTDISTDCGFRVGLRVSVFFAHHLAACAVDGRKFTVKWWWYVFGMTAAIDVLLSLAHFCRY